MPQKLLQRFRSLKEFDLSDKNRDLFFNLDKFQVLIQEYKQSFILAMIFLVSSSSVVMYNKWLLSGFQFHFPLTFVKLAYTLTLLFMWIIRYLNRKWKLLLPSVLTTNIPLTHKQILSRALPFGLMCALETLCSVASLQLLPISFHTMIRALVPAGVLLISFGTGIQSFRWSLLAVVVIICGGVILLSFGEKQDAEEIPQRANFSIAGIVLALLSVIFNSIEWVFSEALLQGEEYNLGALDLLFYGSPFAGLTLLPIFFFTEFLPLVKFVQENSQNGLALEVVLYFLLVGSFFLMFMFVAEFIFVKASSALSLSICHSVKELFLTIFGVLAWGDAFGKLDIFGFIIAMSGVLAYNVILYNDSKHVVRYHQVPADDIAASEGSRNRLGSNNKPIAVKHSQQVVL